MLNLHRNSTHSCDVTSRLSKIEKRLENLERRIGGNTQLLIEILSKFDAKSIKQNHNDSPNKDTFFPANNLEELDSLCSSDNIVS